MVAQHQTHQTPPADPQDPHDTPYDDPESPSENHPKSRGGVTRLITAVTRLVDLQYRIWLTQLKLAMMRIAVSAGLLIGAAVMGILAIIFLCIGVFHVLLEVVGLPPWAAFLIFGGGLALIAGTLALIAVKMLTRTEKQDDAKAEKEKAT